MGGQGAEEADAFLLAFGGEIAPEAAARIQNAGAGGLRIGGKLDQAMGGGGGLPCGIVEIEKARRAGFVDGIEPPARRHRLAAGIVLIGDAFPAGQPGRADLVIQHHGGIGQIVEERFKPFVEEVQPMFHALMLASGADRLVERVIRSPCPEFQPVVLAEAGDGGVVQDHLGHGGEIDGGELFGGALAFGIEAARAVEDIAEEIQPDGRAAAGRPDVDDAAAQGIVARFRHGGDGGKAHAGQEGAQVAFVDAVAHAGREGRAAQHLARGEALGGGIEGGEQDEGALDAFGQGGQRGHPPRRKVGVGRDAIIGQAIPGGQIQHKPARGHHGEGRCHRLGPLVIAGDVDEGRAAIKLAGEEAGVEAFGRAAEEDAGSCLHGP